MLIELPPSGVSRTVLERGMTGVQKTIFMLLGGVGPHLHPRTETRRRAAGWFGVDRPHLRWARAVGVASGWLVGRGSPG